MVVLRHLLELEDAERCHLLFFYHFISFSNAERYMELIIINLGFDCTSIFPRIDKVVLSNGDVYYGSLKGVLPHGKGKYKWLDGTIYEGDWEEGKMTGKGQVLWLSGAKYEGDFSGGYLNGFGTFIGYDGSEYKGAWRMNIQHGLGAKKYSNSDVYEGCWKEGLHEGSGRYLWTSYGNLYIGNWKGGKMCGRGVMKWANGDIFDGSWLNGFKHGSGVYRFADGGYYFGTWTKGLKDGKGTFYPAGTKHPSLRRFSSSQLDDEIGSGPLSCGSSFNSNEGSVSRPSVHRSNSEKISITGVLRNSGRILHRATTLDQDGMMSTSFRESIHHEPSGVLPHAPDEVQSERSDGSVVYEREYMQGVLKKERVVSVAMSHKTKHRNKSHTTEAKKKSCVDIFEGHRSHYLMLNLQLGIR